MCELISLGNRPTEAQASIPGQRGLSKGARSVSDDLDDLANAFDSLDTHASDLLDLGDELELAAARLTCEEADLVRSDVTDFQVEAEKLKTQTSSIGKPFHTASRVVDNGRRWAELGLLSIIVLACVTLMPVCIGDHKCLNYSGFGMALSSAVIIVSGTLAIQISIGATKLK